MIEPKPLTKEERSLLESWVNGEDAVHLGLKKALAAEAYWREAVKNSGDFLEDTQFICRFCGASMDTVDENYNDIDEQILRSRFQHRTDCAWVRAQE